MTIAPISGSPAAVPWRFLNLTLGIIGVYYVSRACSALYLYLMSLLRCCDIAFHSGPSYLTYNVRLTMDKHIAYISTFMSPRHPR